MGNLLATHTKKAIDFSHGHPSQKHPQGTCPTPIPKCTMPWAVYPGMLYTTSARQQKRREPNLTEPAQPKPKSTEMGDAWPHGEFKRYTQNLI